MKQREGGDRRERGIMRMGPLFTIRAGEYRAGSHIERTQRQRVRLTSLQRHRNRRPAYRFQRQNGCVTSGKVLEGLHLAAPGSPHAEDAHGQRWWALQQQNIQKSQADFWKFVLPLFFEHKTSFILIPPGQLLGKLRLIRRTIEKRIDLYL